MSTEKSPFMGKKMSINKIGSVMRYLLDYNRFFTLEMCKGSKIILRGENTVIGPYPNWKAYKILCLILVFEQDEARKRQDAKAAIKNRPLFITPGIAAEPSVFTPPVV